MKKLFALIIVTVILFVGVSNVSVAQVAKKDAKAVAKTEVKKDAKAAKADTTKAVEGDTAKLAEKPIAKDSTVAAAQEKSFHQVLKDKFIEGGAGWMAPILICMILGLALVVERIIYLNMASTNSKKLLTKIEASLAEGGVEAAKDVCRNTRGPLASVFYQGLDRVDEGIEIVEKSVVSYGSVQMGRLESNLGWIGLAISLAPMLGFLGTVVGMVQAFDAIETAGDISPTVVAAGMKVALLTTVFGLITALILQVFYSYIVSKIDSIVNQMEDATISFMDIIVKFKR
ncbi:MAG: MotA/TolQ/ExbB proton channel family protein [Bacteroidota bacterium]